MRSSTSPAACTWTSPPPERRRKRFAWSKTLGCSLAPGTWHHVALVLDAPIWAATVYVDGAIVQSCDYHGGVLASGHKALVLGKPFNEQLSNVGAFTGSLDDVRFYARALSPTEISQIYNDAE